MSLIFGAIAGFVTAVIAEVSKFFIHRENKKYELALLDLKSKINNNHDQNDNNVCDNKQNFEYSNNGIKWVDAINGLIRPLITIILICLYTFVRVMSQHDVVDGPYWTEEDTTLLTAVISYYFGQRAVGKNYG